MLQVPSYDFTTNEIEEESEQNEDEFYSEEEEKMYIMSLIKEYFEDQGLDKKTIQDILMDFKNNRENIYITRLRKLAESLGYLSLGVFLFEGYNRGRKLYKKINRRNPRDIPSYYPAPNVLDALPNNFVGQQTFFPGGTAYPPPAAQ